MTPHALRRQRGSATAVALGFSMVLLVVGAGTATYVLNQLHATGLSRQRLAAFYVADAGIAQATAWFGTLPYALPDPQTYLSSSVPVTFKGKTSTVALPGSHPDSYTDVSAKQRANVVASFNAALTKQTLGGGTFTVTASLISVQPEQWQLLSTGSYGTTQQQVGALLRRAPSTLLPNALYGRKFVNMVGNAMTDSYDSSQGGYSRSTATANGHVRSDGDITLTGNATVNGNATPGADGEVALNGNASVTGSTTPAQEPLNTPAVQIPSTATYLGNIILSGNKTKTLTAGTYSVGVISLSGNAKLIINNSAGPVIIYASGSVTATGNGIVTKSGTCARFVLYQVGGADVTITGNGSFCGGVYAPESRLSITGNADLYGAFVGASISVTGNGSIHYDRNLQTVRGPAGPLRLVSWWRTLE
jgi:Tfp pilus assembly protein PilX